MLSVVTIKRGDGNCYYKSRKGRSYKASDRKRVMGTENKRMEFNSQFICRIIRYNCSYFMYNKKFFIIGRREIIYCRIDALLLAKNRCLS